MNVGPKGRFSAMFRAHIPYPFSLTSSDQQALLLAQLPSLLIFDRCDGQRFDWVINFLSSGELPINPKFNPVPDWKPPN